MSLGIAHHLDGDQLYQLLLGSSVLGTGGGGSFSLGRAMVDDLAARGLIVALLDINDLAPDALGVSTVILGGGLTHEELEKMGMISDEPASVAGARELSRYLGRPIDFVFPIEIGPQNTLEAVRLAAFLGVPLVNGDCAGRAVPEMQQTTLSLHRIPLTPYVVTTFQGDTVILPRVSNDARNEALCRALARTSGGVICVTGFPVEGRRLKEALIPDTLSRCQEIGAYLSQGAYAPNRLAEILGARVAFQGKADRFEMSAEGGFFQGFLHLEGIGAFAGSRYRIGIQNEFMWAWKNGEIDIQCPDLICVVDATTGIGKVTYGHGFENSLEEGQVLDVLHVPCAEAWRSETGRAAFPPPPAG